MLLGLAALEAAGADALSGQRLHRAWSWTSSLWDEVASVIGEQEVDAQASVVPVLWSACHWSACRRNGRGFKG
jgi:hypothetical protein